jgi:hypothetical protein
LDAASHESPWNCLLMQLHVVQELGKRGSHTVPYPNRCNAYHRPLGIKQTLNLLSRQSLAALSIGYQQLCINKDSNPCYISRCPSRNSAPCYNRQQHQFVPSYIFRTSTAFCDLQSYDRWLYPNTCLLSEEYAEI